MPAKNHLDQEQKTRLLKTLKESENPYVRERILILLLMNDGKTYHEISNFLEISYPTVAHWAIHADADNLESLKDGRQEGNYRKVTKKYEQLLLETIEKEPSEYGYEFGRWTAARLATYLEKETGIKLSGSQVRRILEKKKYVYIWAKYSLKDKQDPKKRKIFQEKLSEYLRIAKISNNRLQVWFWDETGFSLRVIRRKTWSKKGKTKEITGKRSQGRVNIMGGLRYTDKKRLNFFIKKGNGDTFFEQLKILNEFVKKEWEERGNKGEDFKKQGPQILIVLDNASFHKRKDILMKIESELPNIRLEFLPPYSPDYNLIELVWHSAKEYISNKLFESVEELENLLKIILNEEAMVIKWGRKIKNKGHAIC